MSEVFTNAKRDAEDLSKVVNQTSGSVINRTGTTMRALPVIIAEVEASRVSAQAEMAADVSSVDASRIAAQADIAADVAEVNVAADNALDDINTAAQQIPDAIKLIGGDWQFYTDITTIPTAGLVAGNRATDLDSGLQYQWAFYEGTSDGFWTPFLAGWGAPSHQNLPGRNAPNAHEADAINMGSGISLGALLLKPISSVSELRATPGNIDGQQVNLISRDGVSADGGGRLVWRASATNTDDDVRWFAVSGVAIGRWEFVSGQIMSDMTIRIPSDSTTLQEAVDSIHGRIFPAQGVIVDLLIESGHQPASGISVSNGDYGYFRVSSVDAEVTLSPLFNNATDFLFSLSAVAPVMNCLVNAAARCRNGCYYYGGSGTVNAGCGVRYVLQQGLYVEGANVTARGSNFDYASQEYLTDVNAKYSGILCWAGVLDAQAATCNNSAYYGAQAAAGGSTNFRGGKAQNCKSYGVRATNRGNFNARSANVSGSGVTNNDPAIRVFDGSSMNAQSIVATGCFNGAWAEHDSYINLNSATIVASDTAIVCIDGHISAKGSVCTGSGKAVRALDGGEVVISGMVADNLTESAIECTNGGSVKGSTVSFKNCLGTSALMYFVASDARLRFVNTDGCDQLLIEAREGSDVVCNRGIFTGRGAQVANVFSGSNINVTFSSVTVGETNVAALNAINGNSGIIWA